MTGDGRPVGDTQASDVPDRRQYSPSSARNRGPILDVLRQVVPPAARVVELGSGTGEHAVHFAQNLEDVEWWPSDPDASRRASISDWRDSGGLEGMHAPLDLSSLDPEWSAKALSAIGGRVDAIVSINMIHISPWQACEGLFRRAPEILKTDGLIYLYGPFAEGGAMVHSNEAFDRHLRSENSQWGIRKLSDVEDLAASNGFVSAGRLSMPANNLSVWFSFNEVR